MLVVSYDEFTKEDLEKYFFSHLTDEPIVSFSLDIKHEVIIISGEGEDHIYCAGVWMKNDPDSNKKDFDISDIRMFKDRIIGGSLFLDSKDAEEVFVLLGGSSIE